jgi:hypothetical protein
MTLVQWALEACCIVTSLSLHPFLPHCLCTPPCLPSYSDYCSLVLDPATLHLSHPPAMALVVALRCIYRFFDTLLFERWIWLPSPSCGLDVVIGSNERNLAVMMVCDFQDQVGNDIAASSSLVNYGLLPLGEVSCYYKNIQSHWDDLWQGRSTKEELMPSSK